MDNVTVSKRLLDMREFQIHWYRWEFQTLCMEIAGIGSLSERWDPQRAIVWMQGRAEQMSKDMLRRWYLAFHLTDEELRKKIDPLKLERLSNIETPET